MENTIERTQMDDNEVLKEFEFTPGKKEYKRFCKGTKLFLKRFGGKIAKSLDFSSLDVNSMEVTHYGKYADCRNISSVKINFEDPSVNPPVVVTR